MRALLMANANDCDPGFTGERFRAHGYSFIESHRERPQDWPTLGGIDLVVLLGSEWSVYWPQVATQVAAERELIREAHARGVPVYGICYGAQAIADALGGAARPATTSEIGWHDDIVSDIPDVIASGPWMQWHGDVVMVPPGAEELARSPLCTQAFRIGRTFATQFHPEVNEAIIARWTTGTADFLRSKGTSPEQLRAESAIHLGASRANARRLVDWYLDHVASVAPSPRPEAS